MLAINHGVALPSYEALSHVGFDSDLVQANAWTVPTDCLRFVKKIAEVRQT